MVKARRLVDNLEREKMHMEKIKVETNCLITIGVLVELEIFFTSIPCSILQVYYLLLYDITN